MNEINKRIHELTSEGLEEIRKHLNINNQQHYCNYKNIQMEYHFRVFTEQLKLAKEDLRQYLRGKGNLRDIDSDKEDSDKYTVVYIDNDGEAQSAYYSEVEVSDENRLYIGLSDGHWLYQEDITVNHIMDIINIIQEGDEKK